MICMFCHKCGTDNTNEYKNGGITIKNNNMKKNNLIKPKRKGKNIMTLAKEIRKKDESWQDALKRAKIEMNKTSSKKSSNIDSELGKLKELIKEDEILKEYNYSKKNTKKSNTRLQKGGDVMSLGIANADAVYNKGGEIIDAPQYHKVRNAEFKKRVEQGKLKDTDENFDKFDEMYFDELVKKGKIDMDNYFAKGGKLSKDDAITKALKLGVDFNKDFHSQSFGNELSELAKETGYRKSKSSSGSLGRSFFNHLQKIYDKNSSYYDSTLNSRGYAKGGEVIEYSKVYEILKDKIDDSVEDISSTYEQAENSKGEEVESKSRDGFIPFTNGGYSSRWFEYSNILEGSGMNLPTESLDDKIEEFRERNREYGFERFEEEYPEIVEELGGIENVNYSELDDAGYGSEAEELDEFMRDDDDTVMMEVEAFYYTPNNDRGENGKHTIQLSGVVNLEAPYHRSGNLEDYIEERFTFDTLKELEDKLDKGLAKVVSWFEGDMYDKNPRELKIRRMESGGRVAYNYENIKSGKVKPIHKLDDELIKKSKR